MAMAMTSKCDTGYEDERFEQNVSASFHCIICTNVIRDPVMCQNEHLFCRVCITTHLKNFPSCPTCVQPLTVETLIQAPRAVRNFLDELKIRCEFFDRGCGKFIELGDIDKHVTDCGFAPVVCSNEGCQVAVNKQDLLHHETAVCELRKVQCHDCKEIRQAMAKVQETLAKINGKLRTTELAVENVVAKVDQVQEQVEKEFRDHFQKLEERSRQFNSDNEEIKRSLREIRKQLTNMAQHKDDAPAVEIAERISDEDKNYVEFFKGNDSSDEKSFWPTVMPVNTAAPYLLEASSVKNSSKNKEKKRKERIIIKDPARWS